MKKNLFRMLSALLILLASLSLLCACGNGASDDGGKTPKEFQKNPLLSHASAGYGTVKTVDGITEYVDENGVTTVAVASDAITVLKVESAGLPGSESSVVIGFDSRSVDLPEGCVLRAELITSQSKPREYNDLTEKMDGKIRVDGTPDGHDFLRIWIEDGEKCAVTQFGGLAMVYVMTGEGKDVCGVCGVDDAEDAEIGYVIRRTPMDGTPFDGKYAVLLLTHFSDAYAVFFER